MKKILISVFFTMLSISVTNEVLAIPIISRTVDGCKNEQCSKTEKVLCNNVGIDGKITEGWCISCQGKGSNVCPRSLAGLPTTADLDQVDLNNGQSLMDYALLKISEGQINGSHEINFNDNGKIRTYVVKWTSDVNNESTKIVVDRN